MANEVYTIAPVLIFIFCWRCRFVIIEFLMTLFVIHLRKSFTNWIVEGLIRRGFFDLEFTSVIKMMMIL